MTAASRLVACLLGALALAAMPGCGRRDASDARSEAMPSDLRPFVRLGVEAFYEVYRNSVIIGNTIVNPGERVEGPIEDLRSSGSGTVVTNDGLILTNDHVYAGVTTPLQYKKLEGGRLLKVTPKCCNILVFENDPDAARSNAPPVKRYRARLVARDSGHDVAVLKIIEDLDGKPVKRNDFAAVRFGNPYDIPGGDKLRKGGELRILGYPGKGGESLTMTSAEFSGYMKGAPGVLDGSLKTVATIAGGNSGGAALYKGKLVGIPTEVTTGAEGAEFAYIRPVTWAARALAIAKLRDGRQIPEIDPQWLNNENNTDITHTSIFLGGRVIGQFTKMGIAGAEVVFHRADRTIQQIRDLDGQVVRTRAALQVQKLSERLTPEQVAQELKMSVEQVQRLKDQLKDVELDPSRWPEDLRRYDRGEFFYAFDHTAERTAEQLGPDGFFFVAVPRGQPLKMVVSAHGFNEISRDYLPPKYGVFADAGAVVTRPTYTWIPSSWQPQPGR